MNQKRQRERIEPSSKRQRLIADTHGTEELNESIRPDGASMNKITTYKTNQETGKLPFKEAIEDNEENTEIAQSRNPSDASNVGLENLSLNELWSQVELTYRRKKTIENVFTQKYGKEWFEFGGIDVEKWIKLLNLFGHMITKLYIDYSYFDLEDGVKLDRCVNECCADSLIELKIEAAPRYVMNDIRKPFSKLESIEFRDCQLASNSTDFNRWYPMMRRMVFSGQNHLDEKRCIEANFPHLRELEIESVRYYEDVAYPVFNEGNVEKVFRMNPNLRRLRIVDEFLDLLLMEEVSQHLQHLETLEIKWDSYKFFDSDCDDVVRLKNVKTLKITHQRLFTRDGSRSVYHYKTACPGRFKVPSFPIFFEQLKEFTIETFTFSLGDESDFLEFISKHSSLQKLTVMWYNDVCVKPFMSTHNKMELAKTCSMVSIITINDYKFSAREAVDFLGLCTSLKQFRFQLYTRSEYDDFVNSLSNKWEASIKGKFIEVNRGVDLETEEAAENEEESSDSEDSIESRTSNESEPLTENNESFESLMNEEDIVGTTEDEILSDVEHSQYSAEYFETSFENTKSDDKLQEYNFVDVDDNLKNMKLLELLQAAESNLQRKSAIDTVFLAKYRVGTVDFSPSYEEPIKYKNDTIFINNIDDCFTFLHCYGHLINKFSLDFNDELLCHSNEYCADSLNKLNIRNAKGNPMRNLKKPFLKVNVIEFKNCCLLSETDFNRWFPQMQSLKFIGLTGRLDEKCIMMPFPYLNHLTIDFNDDVVVASKEKCIENIKKSLLLNPQLRSIAFYNINTEFLRNVSEHLHQLENLEINFHPSDTNVQEIPFSFDRLKTFTLGSKELTENLFEFINKHPTITKLSLSFEKEVHEIQLMPFAEALPLLEIFNLNLVMYVFGGVISLLETCHSLKEFRFRLGDRSKYNGLRLLLDDKWEMSIDDMDYVQLKRRINEAG